MVHRSTTALAVLSACQGKPSLAFIARVDEDWAIQSLNSGQSQQSNTPL
jgi:hypothetical protein